MKTVVVVSIYAPQQGLTNNEKTFYESIIQLIASVNETDTIIICGVLNSTLEKKWMNMTVIMVQCSVFMSQKWALF